MILLRAAAVGIRKIYRTHKQSCVTLLLYVKMGSLQVLMFVTWLLIVSQLVICQDFNSSEYSALKLFYDATEGEYWTYNGATDRLGNTCASSYNTGLYEQCGILDDDDFRAL